MTKVTKTEIMNEVYDLILNANVTQDERAILVNFKNRVTDKNFANELMGLAAGLRQLGIKNLAAQKKMSPETSAFYKKIATLWATRIKLGARLGHDWRNILS